MYRELDPTPDQDPRLTRGPADEAPWPTIALGARMQGIAHLLYAGSLLLAFLLFLLAAVSGGMRGSEAELLGPLVGVVVVLALCGNWILSLIASAILASANAGGKARGMAVAMLACTLLVLIRLPSIGFDLMMIDRGGFGMGGPERMFGGLGLVFLGMCETARLSLAGFYAAAAARAAGKPGLASTANLVGVLTPVILAALMLFSFLAAVASVGGPGGGGPGTGMALVAVMGGATVLLLLFGGVVLFRLAAAMANPGFRRDEE